MWVLGNDKMWELKFLCPRRGARPGHVGAVTVKLPVSSEVELGFHWRRKYRRIAKWESLREAGAFRLGPDGADGIVGK
jgi:hypothetical protein